MNEKIKTILKIFCVAGLLYIFLVSIGLMGAAFKGFGKGFAESLIQTTANPFIGLFIGIFATSLVQSSSTITGKNSRIPPFYLTCRGFEGGSFRII